MTSIAFFYLRNFLEILKLIRNNYYLATEKEQKMSLFENTRHFCFIKHMPKMSGYSNKSVFKLWIKGRIQRATYLCIFFFNYKRLKVKTLLFEYSDIFGICLNKSVLYFQNTDFIFHDPNPFSTYYRRLHISLKIRAKREKTKKYQMCISTLRETFVLSSICRKCQDTQ